MGFGCLCVWACFCGGLLFSVWIFRDLFVCDVGGLCAVVLLGGLAASNVVVTALCLFVLLVMVCFLLT